MVKVVMKLAAYSAIILFMLLGNVASRHLSYDAPELVSDGVSNGNVAREEESFLRLKEDSSEEQCELMYGFLPCSSNIPSHVFLIVIYEYLLYHGESYAGGDGRIFRFLGKNFFVMSFSQLLDSLPDALILLASGLSSSKEKAQEYVVTGAGLLAGSSILLLTLLWGICFICSRKKFYVAPGSDVQDQGISLLTGSGVLTDPETCYHAKVIFYSLIPFVVILLPSVFGVSYSSQEYEIVLLVSLSVSLVCLFCYFLYQLSDSRIQDRRREYAEVEQKVEMHVPFYDVQALMLDREKHLMIKQKELEKTLKDPATCKETKTKEEFYHQFEEWIDSTKQLMDDPYSLDRTGTEYNEVVELLLEDRNKLVDLISEMMERASGERLLRKDGTQDPSVIDSFFRCIDNDNDGSVTTSELKNFIMREEMLVDVEIYHKVFMNNILGFFVLTSVIYFRGLTWHFSAEILVVIIVCIIMGLLASYKSKLPNWTLLIAFPLYPLSLVVVYFVNDAFQFT
ncbi:sodium/calcium exchanger membrane region, Calcium binding protein 2 [Artemisia annua]|uniref:Sodium/calcium exchanger membrane region, Calcium binding protein 2 n=1 Tax=Artemisia annua TaxID=35608 RepID=A0A2U1KCU3_ARTAN|nr:sodium/calcium exchanger membrane region, Calcium binding protein 2 [Artemisia annua]